MLRQTPHATPDKTPDSPELPIDILMKEGKEQPIAASTSDRLSVLPSELISIIFCHACEPIQGNRKWQRDCYPLHLGQLSRRYRQDAWATSELWTTIVIRVISSKVTAQMELLEEWLARALGRPIDIYFETKAELRGPRDTLKSRGKNWNNKLTATLRIINLLAKHSLQWRSIEFYLPSTWYPIFTSFTTSNIIVPDKGKFASTQAPLALPLLISASLHRTDEVITVQRAVGLELSLAPSLQALSLSRFRMSRIFFAGVDFEQITILTFDCVYDMQLHDLLPRLPNLQEATFRHTVSLPVGTRKIRHEKLFKIEAEVVKAIELGRLLSNLTLPRLEFLRVFVPTTMNYNIFTPFSESHLTSLSLTCKITEEFNLIEVLSSLCFLRELYIRDSRRDRRQDRYIWASSRTQARSTRYGLSHKFFSSLSPDRTPSYLPFLETLSYEGNLIVQSIDFLEPLIIRSRMRTSSGISRMYMPNLEKVAVLRKAKIQADQVSELGEFSIAEHPDSQYILEIRRMMEEGVLELIAVDGEFWN